MPFRSEAQRGWMHANEPAMAKRWEKHTPKKKLPKRVDKKAAATYLQILKEAASFNAGDLRVDDRGDLGVDFVLRDTNKMAVFLTQGGELGMQFYLNDKYPNGTHSDNVLRGLRDMSRPKTAMDTPPGMALTHPSRNPPTLAGMEQGVQAPPSTFRPIPTPKPKQLGFLDRISKQWWPQLQKWWGGLSPGGRMGYGLGAGALGGAGLYALYRMLFGRSKYSMDIYPNPQLVSPSLLGKWAAEKVKASATVHDVGAVVADTEDEDEMQKYAMPGGRQAARAAGQAVTKALPRWGQSVPKWLGGTGGRVFTMPRAGAFLYPAMPAAGVGAYKGLTEGAGWSPEAAVPASLGTALMLAPGPWRTAGQAMRMKTLPIRKSTGLPIPRDELVVNEMLRAFGKKLGLGGVGAGIETIRHLVPAIQAGRGTLENVQEATKVLPGTIATLGEQATGTLENIRQEAAKTMATGRKAMQEATTPVVEAAKGLPGVIAEAKKSLGDIGSVGKLGDLPVTMERMEGRIRKSVQEEAAKMRQTLGGGVFGEEGLQTLKKYAPWVGGGLAAVGGAYGLSRLLEALRSRREEEEEEERRRRKYAGDAGMDKDSRIETAAASVPPNLPVLLGTEAGAAGPAAAVPAAAPPAAGAPTLPSGRPNLMTKMQMDKSAIVSSLLGTLIGAHEAPEERGLEGAVRGAGVGATTGLGMGLGGVGGGLLGAGLGHLAGGRTGMALGAMLGGVAGGGAGGYGGYRLGKKVLWPEEWGREAGEVGRGKSEGKPMKDEDDDTDTEEEERKAANDMPGFTSQDRPEKTKDIYRALKRDHPEMPAEMKARIAARQGKPGKQKQGPPYKGPLTKGSTDMTRNQAAHRMQAYVSSHMAKLSHDRQATAHLIMAEIHAGRGLHQAIKTACPALSQTQREKLASALVKGAASKRANVLNPGAYDNPGASAAMPTMEPQSFSGSPAAGLGFMAGNIGF